MECPREITRNSLLFLEDKFGGKQALERYGTIDDIASDAVFLATDMSSYISTVDMPVDGGITAYTQSTSDEDILATS